MLRHYFLSFFFSFVGVFAIVGLFVLLPEYLAGFSSRQTPVGGFIDFNPPAPTATPVPTPSPELTPATLIIPKLNIQSAVELVGLTETDNMDVPKDAANVAWYKHGTYPSQEGNAVIAGHYDTVTGRPAIFYNLNDLVTGDVVEMISVNAVKSTFVVTEKATIPYDEFPSDYVFKTKTGKNLNLITCGGIWDAKNKIYKDRIVVYTTLKEKNPFYEP